MQILPVKYNMQSVGCNEFKATAFGHDKKNVQNNYTTKDKAIIGATTALGVLGSIAVLAAFAKKPNGGKYSLNPIEAIKNIKNSYIANVKFHDKEVISIGAGSCLGGLAGGYIVDKILKIAKPKEEKL